MLHFLCKNLFTQPTKITFINPNFLQNPCLKSISNSPRSSPTVSYLVNSFGLSPKQASKIAKQVEITTLRRPEGVRNLLGSYGFKEPDIKKLIIRVPSVLVASPSKTLDPKLKFFKNMGFSAPDIARIFHSGSAFLDTDLRDRMAPCFKLLKSLISKEEKLDLAIRASCDILAKSPHALLVPKIERLRDHGVSEDNLIKLLTSGSHIWNVDDKMFDERVKEIIKMGGGPRPTKKMFVHLLRHLSFISMDKREARMDVYRSFGWSDRDIFAMVRKQPTCIAISEKKLKVALDFFMNKLIWKPEDILKAPNVLCLSLEKRIIPRLRILQFLISKGLIKEETCITSSLLIKELDFVKKFVAKYEDKFPELAELKSELSGIDPKSTSAKDQQGDVTGSTK